MNHILIVDDEADIRESLEAILREEDYAITSTGTVAEARTLLRDADFDAVLLDIWLPDGDGLELLSHIRENQLHTNRDTPRPPAPEVIMISGHGTIESAVRATKLGAYDFLEKPLSLDRTLLVLRNAINAHTLRLENQEFAHQLTARATITGQSVSIKALRQQIKLMAPTNGRVLIFGESGTGKELIARTIHAESLRRDRVFVELNCAAIPEDFIETELFGYRHGAGPQAAASRTNQPTEKRGTFERADSGTLFLDEVGDMSLKTQAKVLRALDEQRFYPVGASTPTHVDVRVIAATNKDLEEEIARGNFREDLFDRLNVIPFYVPPLRDRKEDVPLLAREFLADLGEEYGRARIEISDTAINQLKSYDWPGNVRESATSSSASSSSTARPSASKPNTCPCSSSALTASVAPAQSHALALAKSSPPCKPPAKPTSALHFERIGPHPRQHLPRRRSPRPRTLPPLPQNENPRHPLR